MVKTRTNMCLWLTLVSGVCVLAACSGDKDNEDGDAAGGKGGSGQGGSSSAMGGAAGGQGGKGGGAGGSAGGGAGNSGGSAGKSGGNAGNSGGSGGLGTSMSFFITSEKSDTGNLGGLDAADAKCKRLGEAAGVMGKTWAAYLSTSQQNARDRIGMGPWHNQKGVLVASNLAQLHEENGMKNNITQATALTDTGVEVPGAVRPQGTKNEHDIFTGSTIDGKAKPNATCGDWTSATGSGSVGHFDRMGLMPSTVETMSWNGAHDAECANPGRSGGAGRFYCFAR